jgi:7,8-dihydropterin-6-yl-methyl-4-(beta-D-ribofuranosyl)aminobenzene 5'-phosphate synthase
LRSRVERLVLPDGSIAGAWLTSGGGAAGLPLTQAREQGGGTMEQAFWPPFIASLRAAEMKGSDASARYTQPHNVAPLAKAMCLLALSAIAGLANGSGAHAETQKAMAHMEQVRILTVFDNYRVTAGLETQWGFAAVVVSPKATVLFDTGASGSVLLANMKQMKLDPKTVRAIVVSHIHGDHLGGLEGFLDENSNVTVYIPAAFPDSVRHMIRAAGADYKNVTGPTEVAPGVFAGGPLSDGLEEQALVVDTDEGLVVVTGCAHPGIVRLVEAAHAQRPKRPIALVMGGFHLLSASTSDVARIIEAFRQLGVKKVAPSHCTGDAARRQFQAAYGDNFISGGAGNVIVLSFDRT